MSALIIGSTVFAAILCCAPYLLIRAVSGPIHDPEHIAAFRYASQPRRQLKRGQAPDMDADAIGIGGGSDFIHFGGVS
ncbi:hypothetical protein [Sphingomonas sp.]|uniref:hypothetical protein n=1 Tax=Sphingomonas sp. TaxID=28214 RepID=UPI0031D6C334